MQVGINIPPVKIIVERVESVEKRDDSPLLQTKEQTVDVFREECKLCSSKAKINVSQDLF